MQTIAGDIDSVLMKSDDGYAVVFANCGGERVKVVGRLPEAWVGCSIEAVGQWTTHEKYGRQFNAVSAQISSPRPVEVIARYLSCGVVRGVGEVHARALVAAFGDRTLDVIKSEPQRLSEVRGIGSKRAEQLVIGVRGNIAVERVMLWLLGHGIAARLGFRLFRAYGERTIEILEGNPFVLTKLHGVGFKIADGVARRVGLPQASPFRAEAALLHLLQEAEGDGHTTVSRVTLLSKAVALLGTEMPQEVLANSISSLSAEKHVVRHQPGTGNEAIQSKALYEAEGEIAAAVLRLRPFGGIRVDGVKEAVLSCAKKLGMDADPSQAAAVELLLRSGVAIMTGGPGCGKTACLKVALRVARFFDRRVILCAPTGKAAKRMAEATGFNARTIHRTLVYDQMLGGFVYNENRPLEADVIAVDESSMLDARLCAALIRAVATGSQVWFIGDIDQLPSVGAGAVLRDLIRSNVVPCARLTEIHRQAKGSLIIQNAHAINRGAMSDLAFGPDFHFIETVNAQETADRIVSLVQAEIPASGWDPMTDLQVLTAMLKGAVGIEALNGVLQKALNPSPIAAKKVKGRTFSIADRVILTKNNYDLGEAGVFNGTMGRVESIADEQCYIGVALETDELVVFEEDTMDEVLLAYALTVHRAQGSEFAVVVIPLDLGQQYVMLTREWLYTAVTRSKSMCVLVGDRKALVRAVRTVGTKRNTMLTEMITERARQGASIGTAIH